MKIISWNVNGIRAAQKKGLEGFVQTFKPDILCLQETKAHPEQVNPDFQTRCGQWHAWAAAQKKGYSGVATFTNNPPAQHRVGLGYEQFDNEGRVVVSDHGDFLLYNIYFPNGQRDETRQQYKMAFHEALGEKIREERATGREHIILGDYNIAPKEIDIHDPVRYANTSGFLPKEREWFARFLDIGFVDSFRHFHPSEGDRYSWWNPIDRSRMFNRGWRIDLICVSEGLKSRLKSAEILDQVEGSDHCPVQIELAD